MAQVGRKSGDGTSHQDALLAARIALLGIVAARGKPVSESFFRRDSRLFERDVLPLAALPDSKENIRAALNRATHLRGIEVSTSSDAEFLYIWKTEPQK